MHAHSGKKSVKWVGTILLFAFTALSGTFYIVKGRFMRNPASVKKDVFFNGDPLHFVDTELVKTKGITYVRFSSCAREELDSKTAICWYVVDVPQSEFDGMSKCLDRKGNASEVQGWVGSSGAAGGAGMVFTGVGALPGALIAGAGGLLVYDANRVSNVIGKKRAVFDTDHGGKYASNYVAIGKGDLIISQEKYLKAEEFIKILKNSLEYSFTNCDVEGEVYATEIMVKGNPKPQSTSIPYARVIEDGEMQFLEQMKNRVY